MYVEALRGARVHDDVKPHEGARCAALSCKKYAYFPRNIDIFKSRCTHRMLRAKSTTLSVRMREGVQCAAIFP